MRLVGGVDIEDQVRPAPAWRPTRRNMQTFVFRSYDLIVESAEADLVRDVRLDVNKAQTKLRRIQRQLQRDRELAEAREALLSSARNKLAAAIVVALLAGRQEG